MKKFAIVFITLFILMTTYKGILWYEDLTTLTGSALLDLEAEIASIYGDEFTGKELVYEDSELGRISIREDMSVSFKNGKAKPWNESMLKYDSRGIELSRSYWISIYNCIVDIRRYATLDGIELSETETHKIITYNAYEDNDHRSIAIASVDKASAEVKFSESDDIYNDIEYQLKRAYNIVKSNHKI